MSQVFLKVLNMSISAGWLVLAVLVLRLVLKKAPKWVNVLLWGMVAVRLLCPISIESALSLIPSAQTLPTEIISGPDFNVRTGISPVDRQINGYLDDRYFEGVTVPANHGANVMGVLAMIWLVGMAVLLAYTAYSYLRLRRDLRTAVVLHDNIFQCETVSSPFVLGLLRPRIYLPYTLDGRDLHHVVAHERAHIRRFDHWWKPLGFLLLTVHWFNPLMWLAYILLCRDIELACDEKVIAQLEDHQRADYSQALVACAISRPRLAACPLAFGEVGVKERVRAVMNYRKPAFWIILFAVVLCVVLAVSMLTDPVSEATDDPTDPTQPIEEPIKNQIVTEWFSFDETEMALAHGIEDTVFDALPDVTFRADSYAISAIEGDRKTILIQGMPIWNAYWCDLTGDGFPELCATASFGSGMIDTHVVVFDYMEGKEYTLWDRGYMDYYLRVENGILLCEAYPYPMDGSEPKWVGYLNIADDVGLVTQTVSEQPNDPVWIASIVDKTAKGYPSDEAIKPFWEDEKYIYSFPSIRSHLVIVTYSDGHTENIKDALENGRATIADLDQFGIAYYKAPKTDALEAAISEAILNHYASDKPDGLIHVESHVVLDTVTAGGTPLVGSTEHVQRIKVFLLTHHVKYSTYGGKLEAVGGSLVPAALTFDVTDSGYELTDYWEPRDGAGYDDDIRANFPPGAAEKALNDRDYAAALKAETLTKAQSYFAGTMGLDRRIGELLTVIESSPLQSSNPGDYIHAHQDEYDELLAYGAYTLQFCFEEFLADGHTDLRGHIMALACQDIMLSWGEGYTVDGYRMTGQDWFDEFRSNVQSLYEQTSLEDLQKHYPGAFLLLEMTVDDMETKN